MHRLVGALECMFGLRLSFWLSCRVNGPMPNSWKRRLVGPRLAEELEARYGTMRELADQADCVSLVSWGP